jgi:hypothetical protein
MSKLLLAIFGTAMILGSSMCVAAQTDSSSTIVAREASEGPRGGDNEKPGDRQHRGGRNAVNSDEFVIAREAGERPRGEGKGHPRSEDAGNMIVAREAAEGPRGQDNEKPGDRQHRGGRHSV